MPAAEKRGRDANERRELGERWPRRTLTGERNEKARARCAGGGIDGDGGGGVGGILNLGGSIDFTIWTPPKVKNKPSRTYSTLIECLSSARLVSTHRPTEREEEGDARNETEQEETAEKEVKEKEEKEGGRGDESRGERGRGNRRGEETGWKRARERQRKGVIKRRKGGRRARGTGRKESGEMP